MSARFAWAIAPSPKWMQLPLHGEATSGDTLFSGDVLPPDWMEKVMTEEKIEQVDEFTEELSDEALDREGAARMCGGGLTFSPRR